ncbi:hypothetical protein EPO44_02065 [bacterium]|nr:MAG: hypothetical protein EPO44_02065 [bacterium]
MLKVIVAGGGVIGEAAPWEVEGIRNVTNPIVTIVVMNNEEKKDFGIVMIRMWATTIYSIAFIV